MYLKEYLEQFDNRKIKIYVDMDGVISDYVVGKGFDFHKKRPLFSNIAKLEEISKMNNVELFILSVTRMNEGIEQKYKWLDENAPFFKKENRVILSKENNDFIEAKDLKSNFLKQLPRDESIIIVIDDDPNVLKEIEKTNPDIMLLKDTALVDWLKKAKKEIKNLSSKISSNIWI